MVILELEELQKHAKNDILAIRVSILTFNSIISPRVIVTIETTLYNHTVNKLLLKYNNNNYTLTRKYIHTYPDTLRHTSYDKKCIEHYETSGNVRVRINASFGSHLNISNVVTPEM